MKKITKKLQLLLLDDVDGLGRKGDVVQARAGYVRNFLLAMKKAVLADAHTLRMRERLQKERAERAVVDRKEAEELAARLLGFGLTVEVKVDPEGKMYGSVSALDLSRLLQEKGYGVEKRHIPLHHPLKEIGKHTVSLKLNEGVMAPISVEIVAEAVTSV